MMKHSLCLMAGLAVSACVQTGASGGGGGTSRASAFTEYLVVGGRMTYEDCKARGGLIVHDQGGPMYLCDPNVLRQTAPSDEFVHPADPAVTPET